MGGGKPVHGDRERESVLEVNARRRRRRAIMLKPGRQRDAHWSMYMVMSPRWGGKGADLQGSVGGGHGI